MISRITGHPLLRPKVATVDEIKSRYEGREREFLILSLISPNLLHIVAHCRATEQVANFTTHLPLAPSFHIVQYIPLCLQIEWHGSRSRKNFGGLGYPKKNFVDIR